MDYKKTEIEGVYIIQPKVFKDNRGYFMETFRQSDFDAGIGRHVEFIQDNESKSSRGVLRGLHYQKGEASHAKLVSGSCPPSGRQRVCVCVCRWGMSAAGGMSRPARMSVW